jgi:protocatechuate 3,4-dioxygenase beta subunit
MHHSDDLPRGVMLRRREWLALLGASGALALSRAVPAAELAPAATTTCVGRPEQTEGPYFVEGEPERSDLRTDPATGARTPGLPLRIEFAVARLAGGTCRPVPGAVVHVWHCDARGIYSGVRDPGFTTVGQQFLRGYQRTDRDGRAGFVTIYPGWYRGRAVHLHFKVRADANGGRAYDFTSQLYFDDALNDRVLSAAPYEVTAARRVRNQDDFLFRRGGSQLLLQPKDTGDGLAARFNLGLMMG